MYSILSYTKYVPNLQHLRRCFSRGCKPRDNRSTMLGKIDRGKYNVPALVDHVRILEVWIRFN
jgi:hypothetical protein